MLLGFGSFSKQACLNKNGLMMVAKLFIAVPIHWENWNWTEGNRPMLTMDEMSCSFLETRSARSFNCYKVLGPNPSFSYHTGYLQEYLEQPEHRNWWFQHVGFYIFVNSWKLILQWWFCHIHLKANYNSIFAFKAHIPFSFSRLNHAYIKLQVNEKGKQ